MKDNKYQQIPFLIIISGLPFLLFTCWIILPRCQTWSPERKIREVDSLIELTINLQKKISSQAIQMLNDFSYEMDKDLLYFYDTVLQQLPEYIIPQELEEYADLQKDIENCLAACKKYNEEVFLIENNLRDVRDKLIRNSKHHEELDSLIETEKELLDDLLLRIQNNIGFIELHVEEYLYLKPLMDTLKLKLIVE